MRSPISQRTAKNNAKAFNEHFTANKQSYKKKVVKRKTGGGRKLKYGEPCQLVTFKCPESKAKAFRVSANKILKSYVKELKPY